MFRVFDCIVGEHDLRYVVIAAFICLFGCFAAVNLLLRARGQDGRTHAWWIAAAAVVGGGGIWATHFVAMLAFRTSIPVAYDTWLTLLSIAIAVVFSGLAFSLCRYGRGWATFGGAVAGIAVALMHFTGMYAIRGPVHLVWSPGYVIASVLIAMTAGAIALRTLSVEDHRLTHRIGATGLYVVGIVGLHFTAMTGLTLLPDPAAPAAAQTVDPRSLAILVAAVTTLIIGIGLMGSFVDQHLAERSIREAKRLRDHVEELEATKAELVRTTETLTVALDQAAASSQAKSQFLATMSHELRTPLNAIIGFSQMISAEPYGPVGSPQYSDFAKLISSSGSHLLSLINDILDLSSLDAGALTLDEEEVDLSDVVRQAVGMLSDQAAKAEVGLEMDLPLDMPLLLVDVRRIRQVVINLLSNAVKFTPSGGQVRVLLEHRDAGVVLTVSDTGIGMSPEDIPVAFERFGQVDNSLSRKYEGTGLGLPLSRDLVHLHGGRMVLESAPGEGTSVSVELPRSRIVADRRVA